MSYCKSVKQGYEGNVLISCTYLETEVTYHVTKNVGEVVNSNNNNKNKKENVIKFLYINLLAPEFDI
jgi:hypothetical protein